jgi:hypothetical protein
MLAKCANPACSAIFHYFHEGKLFTIESRIDSPRTGLPTNLEYTGRAHRLQCFWLCSSCCCAMTVRCDGDQGVVLVRKQGMPPNCSVMKDRPQMVA